MHMRSSQNQIEQMFDQHLTTKSFKFMNGNLNYEWQFELWSKSVPAKYGIHLMLQAPLLRKQAIPESDYEHIRPTIDSKPFHIYEMLFELRS